jgi:hypothetical protein
MAIRGRKLSQVSFFRKGITELPHFDYHLRSLTLAGAEDNGALPRRRPTGSTPAMSVSFEAESPALEPASCQQRRCDSDYYQRYQLLPIHVRNITHKTSRCNYSFRLILEKREKTIARP